MRQHIENLVAAVSRTRDYSNRLLVGIPPEKAALKPRFESNAGVVIVDTNHANFVCGHLGLYAARIHTFLGKDPSGVAAPEGWDLLYKAGVPCEDDPKHTIYPAWDKVVDQFVRSTDATIQMLGTLHDDALTQPMTDEKARQFFPVVGMAVSFMLTSHICMHMGQLSAWRRCFGLPAAT